MLTSYALSRRVIVRGSGLGDRIIFQLARDLSHEWKICLQRTITNSRRFEHVERIHRFIRFNRNCIAEKKEYLHSSCMACPIMRTWSGESSGKGGSEWFPDSVSSSESTHFGFLSGSMLSSGER